MEGERAYHDEGVCFWVLEEKEQESENRPRIAAGL